jgi:hypothetical protein
MVKVTLESLSVGLEDLSATLERMASLLAEGFEQVRGDIADLQHDMTFVKRKIVDIETELQAHGKAIDKDAVMLIDHEKRIKTLERRPRRLTA